MIKNIYDKRNKHYIHEYYCDKCFSEIRYGEIKRHDKAIEEKKFDLCSDCAFWYWDTYKQFKEISLEEAMELIELEKEE